MHEAASSQEPPKIKHPIMVSLRLSHLLPDPSLPSFSKVNPGLCSNGCWFFFPNFGNYFVLPPYQRSTRKPNLYREAPYTSDLVEIRSSGLNSNLARDGATQSLPFLLCGLTQHTVVLTVKSPKAPSCSILGKYQSLMPFSCTSHAGHCQRQDSGLEGS